MVMRRTEQKAATRAKILELAARRLRQEGLSGNGVHRLMRDAGLTHGGFYVHFPSKEALDAAAFSHAAQETKNLDGGLPPDATVGERRKLMARRYLSRTHRDAPDTGCAFSAVLGEASRGGPQFRQTFEAALLAALERRRPGAGQTSQMHDLALMALAMGGLALARAVPNQQFSDAILKACREASGILADAYEADERKHA